MWLSNISPDLEAEVKSMRATAIRDPKLPLPATPAFSVIVIGLLIAMSTLAPLATSSYLPALPIAQTDLGATAVSMQLSLTTFIIGTAIGQLLLGPISDVIGRRISLFMGIAIFAGASAAIAFVPDSTWLIWLRVLQGIGAGGGAVLGRAIVADRTRGTEAARLLGIMMAIGVVVPAAAPLFGVAVLRLTDWRGIFGSLAVIGAIILVFVMLLLPETRVRQDKREKAIPRADAPRAERRRSWPAFLGYTAAVGLAFAAMYSMIASGPYLYQQQFGFSAEAYAGINAGISITMGALTFVGTQALGKTTRFGVLTPRRVAGWALAMLLMGGVLVAGVYLLDAPVWAWIGALAFANMPAGLASGTLMALAMDAAPIPPGSASAAVGVVHASFGAAMPPIIGLGGGAPAAVMVIALVTAAALALIAFRLATAAAPVLAEAAPLPTAPSEEPAPLA